MTLDDRVYQSPLVIRYASPQMTYLFSNEFKVMTWRRLWVSLAKAQKKLGLSITEAQIRALEKNIKSIDFKLVEELEKQHRHDVMAHILAYASACPEAKGIIHLGATSAFVTDNADLIQMRQGLQMIRSKLLILMRILRQFAKKYAYLGTLSYTHLQPAQPTTVGKRSCLWLQDFLMDFEDVMHQESNLRFLGVKGTTGTQASFLALFNQNSEKVKKLDRLVSKDFGFDQLLTISGQTYTRKQDIRVLSALTSLASSAHKCATDLRLLAHFKEIDEPFEEKQIGSSAMPHKRNPMRSERICALSRFLISLGENPHYTHATQWLERSLDDSANRRLCIPEAFLCADAILNLLINIAKGLKVYPAMIAQRLEEELPFIALENILMACAKKGKDRQLIHEKLRSHSLAVSKEMKEKAKPIDLLTRLSNDRSLGLSKKELKELVKVEHFIGRSEEQVDEFLKQEVDPVLKKYRSLKASITPIKL